MAQETEKLARGPAIRSATPHVEKPATGARPGAGLGVRGMMAVAITLVCWASAFPGIRAGLTAYSPGEVALLRYLVASAALAGFALATRMRLPTRQDVLPIALIGVIGISVYNLAL